MVIDVPALIAERREVFGDDFVAGRLRPEADARALLDASAGSMTREQAIRLGGLLNEHTKVGVVRQDRFSPAFVGASLHRVIEDLATFNDRVSRLWRGDEEAALDALDETVRNRSLFPRCGVLATVGPALPPRPRAVRGMDHRHHRGTPSRRR